MEPNASDNEFRIAAIQAKSQYMAWLKTLSPEQLEAHKQFVSFWRANYMKSGHKWLGRIILDKDGLPYEVK